MRRPLALLILVFGLGLPTAAGAAPVFTQATLSITLPGITLPFPIVVNGSGTVSVVGSTVTVPAGLITQTGTILVPASGANALVSIEAVGLANLSGTFRLGGVTSQRPGEVCPGIGNNPLGFACNAGGGVGGAMALTGSILLTIVPSIVVIPVNLNAGLLGQGGSTNLPAEIDAAAWSTGSGLLPITGNITGPFASGTGSPLTLVTPTFVRAFGNTLPFVATLTLTAVHLPVPEPAELALIGAGVLGLVLSRSRRR